MSAAPAPPDVIGMIALVARAGHNGALGLRYVDHGADWCTMALDWRPDLVGDPATGVLASGPIVAMLDMVSSVGAWIRRGALAPQATLDMRVDYLRAAGPQRTVIARGECYRVTRRIAFVRGIAHDGELSDPVATMAGTFMFTDAP